MSEPGDFVPPPEWRTHDMKKARLDYDVHAGRSYAEAVSQNKVASELIEPNLETLCMYPIAVLVDQTSSMDGWQGVIVGKLPNLEREAKEYFGEDFEISLGAFGDAHNNERYPLQVRPFARGVKIKEKAEELIMESLGGGQIMEDSELAAFYYARNVSMPNAVGPIFILITDEMPHPFVLPKHAQKYAGVTLKERMSAEEVFKELKRKWSVYVVLKPYGDTTRNEMDNVNLKIYNRWTELAGIDHIAPLAVPERVVDVIFGFFAQEKGRVPYFRQELIDRQTPEQVQQIFKSLKTVHALPAPEQLEEKKHSGKSIMFRPKKGNQ